MIARRINQAINSKKNKVNAYSMTMSEWKNIIMLFKTLIHINICFVISIPAVIL